MLGRAGYAAKGIVYIVIGALAAKAAAGSGGATTDSRGALGAIQDGPMGTIALVAIGIGLLGYMAWRLVAAVTDAEGKGDEPTKLAVRAAQAARGLVYGALGVQALRMINGDQGGAQGEQTRNWTARLLEMPYGRALVVALGLGVIGYAIYQLYRAFSDKAKKHLDLAQAGPTQATWIVRFGRFGIAARGVVFAMIGVFLVRAGMQSDSGQAGGMAQSLQELGGDYGKYVLGAVAFGLIAYGLYQLATARYRRMRAVG
jgi:Domain of Unknown Function (DUF1206)